MIIYIYINNNGGNTTTMKNKFKELRYISLILIVCLILCIPLLSSDLDVYYDDGIQHIARAYSTNLSIKNHEHTTVLSNLANGFGYSWDLFYGPLSSIMIILGKLITTTFISGYKLVLFIGLLLSGITMYAFVYKLTNNKLTSTIASIFYIIMPYHLTDMYIRNAVGEFLSYIFIPLVFLGLYNLFHKEKRDWLLCLGAVGLLLTHNLMTFLTAIMAFIYLCTNFSKLKDTKILKKLFFNVVCILCISAFFWMPMVETALSGEYQVYQENAMSTADSFAESALDLEALFFTQKDATHVFEMGIPIIIILCLSIFTIKKVTGLHYKKEYILFLCLGILCLIMTTKYFPWNLCGNYFKMIQFPWRMLVFANFFLAIICALNIQILIKNFNIKDVIFFSFVCVLCTVPLINFLPTDQELVDMDQWSIGILTENTSDVIAGMGKSEYLPVKFNKHRSYILNKNGVSVLSGKGDINEQKKDGQSLTCNVEIFEDHTILEFPYTYYPGYHIFLNGMEVDGFQSSNGLLAISVNKMELSTVMVQYTGTFVMHLSRIISVISVLGFMFYIFVCHFRNKFIL